ncbi:MAG: hypothetical protein Q8O55_08940 [Dehalococcoidales bacterium]|nr:hypothetical protein [Dehalococcoidales bacterium]
MFEYQPGVLVKSTTNGQLGIVLSLPPSGLLEIFLGDGLIVVNEDKHYWDIVPFNDAGEIPASFSELVNAYCIALLKEVIRYEG